MRYENTLFDFSVPPVDPAKESVAPFTGSTVVSRECSALGAERIERARSRLQRELVAAYQVFGPLTDAEAAAQLNVERTTVIPRRVELIRAGVVDPEPKGVRVNPKSRVSNSTWGLKQTSESGGDSPMKRTAKVIS